MSGIFKAGDKIVCVDKSSNFNISNIDLTCGGIYDVYEDSIINSVTGAEVVYIDDDKGMGYFFSSHRFISLREYRNRMIDSVLV